MDDERDPEELQDEEFPGRIPKSLDDDLLPGDDEVIESPEESLESLAEKEDEEDEDGFEDLEDEEGWEE